MAWIDGDVLEVDGDEVKISCSSGKTVSAVNLLGFTILLYIIQLIPSPGCILYRRTGVFRTSA